jgi:hypothetical protein
MSISLIRASTHRDIAQFAVSSCQIGPSGQGPTLCPRCLKCAYVLGPEHSSRKRMLSSIFSISASLRPRLLLTSLLSAWPAAVAAKRRIPPHPLARGPHTPLFFDGQKGSQKTTT